MVLEIGRWILILLESLFAIIGLLACVAWFGLHCAIKDFPMEGCLVRFSMDRLIDRMKENRQKKKSS